MTGYAVARRTPEIGIRMALGLFGAWAARGVIAQYVFQVTPTDGATLIGVSVLLGAVALLACYLPARRALRVDPVVALRAE